MTALVITACDGTEVLQPIYGSLDNVAAFVSPGVEPWRNVAFGRPFHNQSLGHPFFASDRKVVAQA